MKYLPLLLVAFLLSCSAPSEEPKTADSSTTHEPGSLGYSTVYNIGFYNVENLFDTKDDPSTEDEWFLPESETQWDDEKMETKIDNLAKVIDAMNDGPGGPDLIGLCEVENEDIVWDLAQHELFNANVYEVIHFDSPDTRGIDVAAMFNPDKFELLDTRSISVYMPEDTSIKTRDILFCEFAVRESNEIIYFYVNHWSSRRGGEEETFFKRKRCAETLVEDFSTQIPDWETQNIIIVGDMNDYPTNESLTTILGAGEPEKDARFWNIQYHNHQNGLGTYNYKGEWGCLDNVVIAPQLYDKLITKEAQILREDWMMYTNEKGEQYPNRTYGGSNYYGGYSDHLPVYFEVEL